MTNHQQYIQCKLYKSVFDITPEGTGNYIVSEVSYIPIEFARVDERLKIKNDNDVWEEGWLVGEVYPNSKTTELPDYRKMIRGHRKNTGDSLPKE